MAGAAVLGNTNRPRTVRRLIGWASLGGLAQKTKSRSLPWETINERD
jgi:hypothetical protein